MAQGNLKLHRLHQLIQNSTNTRLALQFGTWPTTIKSPRRLANSASKAWYKKSRTLPAITFHGDIPIVHHRHAQTVAHRVVLDADAQDTLTILTEPTPQKTTTVLWTTDAEKISQAQIFGVTRSQSLTGKAIEKIGQYNLRSLQRKVFGHFTSAHEPLKQQIVDDAIERIQFLQELERHYQDHNIDEQIQTYISVNQNKLQDILIHQQAYQAFLKYDKNYLDDQVKNYQRDIEKAKLCLQQNNVKLRQEFIRERINDIVQQATLQNNIISRLRFGVINRGKLFNYLRDTDATIRNYQFDQHRAINRSHQLDFSMQTKKVCFNSRKHKLTSSKDLENLTLVITYLQGLEEKNLQAAQKNITRLPSFHWRNYYLYFYTRFPKINLKNGLRLIARGVLHFANFFVCAFTDSERFAKRVFEDSILKYEYKHDLSPEVNYQTLYEKLGVCHVYYSSIIGHTVFRFVKEYFIDIIFDTLIGIKDTFTDQMQKIKFDFMLTWLRPKRISELLLKEIAQQNQKFTEIQEQLRCYENGIYDHLIQRVKEKIIRKPDQNKSLQKQLLILQQYSQPIKLNFIKAEAEPKLLTYLPKDLISSFANGVANFVDLIKDEFFDKHPIAGLSAAGMYLLVGSAILIPDALKLALMKIGLSAKASQAIITTAQTFTHQLAAGSPLNQAIVGSFTASQLTAASANLLETGFDSWVVKIGVAIAQQPEKVIVNLAAAYAFGRLLFEIPVIGTSFKEEVGEIPQIGTTLLGAKFGILLYHERNTLASFISNLIAIPPLILRCLIALFQGSAKLIYDHLPFTHINKPDRITARLAYRPFIEIAENFCQFMAARAQNCIRLSLLFFDLFKAAGKVFYQVIARLLQPIAMVLQIEVRYLKAVAAISYFCDNLARKFRNHTERPLTRKLNQQMTQPESSNSTSPENAQLKKQLSSTATALHKLQNSEDKKNTINYISNHTSAEQLTPIQPAVEPTPIELYFRDNYPSLCI